MLQYPYTSINQCMSFCVFIDMSEEISVVVFRRGKTTPPSKVFQPHSVPISHALEAHRHNYLLLAMKQRVPDSALST